MTPRPIAVLLAVVSVCAASGCVTFRNDDAWFARDKFYHFTAAAVIGAGTALAADGAGCTGTEAAAWGITAGVGAGAAKEIYDSEVKHTGGSWKDMAWDFLGASVGATVAAQAR